MKFINVTFLIILCTISCQIEQPEKQKTYPCGEDFLCYGEFVQTQYTFCGIVPKEIFYTYKKGYWKFWDKKMNVIAEGEFDIDTESINTNCEGGADVFVSKIDDKKWRFYNEEGEEISPENELVSKIEKSLF